MKGISNEYDFINYLNIVFLERLEKNEQYSLRAFARDLSVDHSNLSKLLRKKKTITPDQIKYIAKQLKLSTEQTDTFLEFRASKGKYFDPFANPEITDNIDHWSYLAILELCTLPEVNKNLAWFGTKLNLPKTELKTRIQKLVELELLVKDSSGSFSKNQNESMFQSNYFSSDQTRRAINTSIAQLNQRAISTISFDELACTGMLITFDPTKIKSAKESLRNFSMDFDESHNVKKNSELFLLQTSLIPVGKIK